MLSPRPWSLEALLLTSMVSSRLLGTPCQSAAGESLAPLQHGASEAFHEGFHMPLTECHGGCIFTLLLQVRTLGLGDVK